MNRLSRRDHGTLASSPSASSRPRSRRRIGRRSTTQSAVRCWDFRLTTSTRRRLRSGCCLGERPVICFVRAGRAAGFIIDVDPSTTRNTIIIIIRGIYDTQSSSRTCRWSYRRTQAARPAESWTSGTVAAIVGARDVPRRVLQLGVLGAATGRAVTAAWTVRRARCGDLASVGSIMTAT